jgi:hypothetical protein
MAPPPVSLAAPPQAYPSWGSPPQSSVVQPVAPPAVYQTHYAQLPTPVPAQAPQWGQPPPAMTPAHSWPAPSPAAPPPLGPTMAYATPPPVGGPGQYPSPAALYAPSSTPQPHALWVGPPPGPTPPPQAVTGLPALSGESVFFFIFKHFESPCIYFTF